VEYIVSFSPWIAYGAVASVLDWRAGAICAAVVQAVVAVSLIRKQELDVLSIGTLIFFGALSAIALISPHSPIHRWIPALSAGGLAVIAATSLLVGEPFTLAIARRTTPTELWTHPEFIRLNRFLTSVWAASFASAAIASTLLIALAKNETSLVIIANVVAVVTAFAVTRRTVRKAEARAAEAGLI
jgi:hypothetical protein